MDRVFAQYGSGIEIKGAWFVSGPQTENQIKNWDEISSLLEDESITQVVVMRDKSGVVYSRIPND